MNNQGETICPLDGRYKEKTKDVRKFWNDSEYIFMRLVFSEQYVLFLTYVLPDLWIWEWKKQNSPTYKDIIFLIDENNRKELVAKAKEYEKTTNHDVMAIINTVRDFYRENKERNVLEPFIHFGLTSNDINSLAYAYLMKNFIESSYLPKIKEVLSNITALANQTKNIVMLSFTHGQPATPTTFGNQMLVFVERLANEIHILETMKFTVKCGGATGGMNAHHIAYPEIDWKTKLDEFCLSFGLHRQQNTTQIDHYDNYSRIFDCVKRINNILFNFSSDIWMYIFMGYLKLKINPNETGSSTMCHKVNPWETENAKANLELANAEFETYSKLLPVSILQRTIGDSTIMRNVGMPFGYSYVAYSSILSTLGKIELNQEVISNELNDHWEVLSEAVQTMLRKYRVPNAYDLLKKETRNGNKFDQQWYVNFVTSLESLITNKDDYQRLLALIPETYLPIC